jgi:hypothetical protein
VVVAGTSEISANHTTCSVQKEIFTDTENYCFLEDIHNMELSVLVYLTTVDEIRY